MKAKIESGRPSPLFGPAPAVGDRGAGEVDPQRKFRPNVYWYLTFRCNLSCAHCWVQSSPRVDVSEDLTTAEAMAVIEQLTELNAGACTLSGGEVLTRRDAVEIIERLGASGIKVMVETNGLLIGDRFLEVAGRLQRGVGLNIGISLDGGDAATHERLRGPRTFHRTVCNLYRLKEHDVRFNLQCTVNRTNIETIPALYDIAADLRPALRCLGFCLLNPLGRGEELAGDLGVGFKDLERILTLIRRHKSRFAGVTLIKAPPAAIPPRFLPMALKESLVSTLVTCQFPLLGILPNSDVTICALSRENQELRFGNVRTSRLAQMWHQARLDVLRRRYLAADHLQGICGDCIWNRGCRGACRAWAYQDGASFDAPYPLCAALADAGEFPAAYRISAQRQVLERHRPAGGCAGCGPEQEMVS